MSILVGAFGWFRRSLLAQIIAGIVAFLAAWKANNLYVAYDAGQKERERISEKTKVEGRKRNAEVSKIRNRIKRDGAWDRLRKQYGRRD